MSSATSELLVVRATLRRQACSAGLGVFEAAGTKGCVSPVVSGAAGEEGQGRGEDSELDG